MLTATIQIGNSDNKLSQNEWAHFVEYAKGAIEGSAHIVHFFGGSDPFAPWQNACWVIELQESMKQKLRQELRRVCKSFRQDSIAITYGTTEFLTPE